MSDLVLRTFKVIEYLSNVDDWASLRPMARDLAIDPATMHRILTGLKEIGYVRQHPSDSRYQLTLKIAAISARLLEKSQLRQIAHPIMEDLTLKTNETSHLAILEGMDFVYIHKVDNQQAVRMRSRVGQRGQLHSTSVGKSILAFIPEEDLNKILPRIDFRSVTPNTITDIHCFKDQLNSIRTVGYAVDDEENEVGIRCIGAPIFDHIGRVAGALSVSGWTISVTRERVPELAVQVLLASQRISKDLGWIETK